VRKLAVTICLIGLLIGSTLGGLALADKGGDPNYGSSPLGEIGEISGKIDNLDENGSAVLEGIGNITDRLDNPQWGLAEIKSEIQAIEGNMTDQDTDLAAIKAEVESIRNDLDELLYTMPCTTGELDLYIGVVGREDIPIEDQWSVQGWLETLDYDVYNIDLDLFIDGNKLDTIHLDVLVPGATYWYTLTATYEITGTHYVAVRARGSAPWGECLTDKDAWILS
jgi:hypothetical protein